ncbi:hypothetical protein Celaphus_00002478 [Cervus elaphus hippelaphus]|uniref:Uncharacterized protein n=1 Tax=Cervus elaphus hippelaphus TaxID=46360 RepID=A0A212CHC4_CEREH|nr:hypothetical protein Celaphus_00002478 [Cervus elaphus hippelaphus]
MLAFYPHGLSCTCFTRQRHSYPHCGKLSITWCICCSESHHTLVKKHMSPYVNRGLLFQIALNREQRFGAPVSVLRKGESSGKNVTLTAVVKAPIRPDAVNFVHTNLSKNNRQPYAVSELAVHQTSAESWGTSRAVA